MKIEKRERKKENEYFSKLKNNGEIKSKKSIS